MARNIFEGGYYHLPVIIASRVGGIPDQVNHGVEGLLADDPTDLGSFANLSHGLLSDEATRDSLGTGARRRAISEFLMDRHLMQYLMLLTR